MTGRAVSRISWRNLGRSATTVLQAEDGYAAVDALVALTIFATTIVFAMLAVQASNQAAKAALEARRADEILKGLLELATTNVGTTKGSGASFSWTLTVQPPSLSAGGGAICEQDALAVSLGTGRRYQMSSARVCPANATS